MAPLVSPGNYFGDMSPASLFAGAYSISGSGGPDVGAFQGNFTVPPQGQWTNTSDFSSPFVTTGQAFSFRWTGGDPNGDVTIRLSSSSATLTTMIVCNAPTSPGTFTVPNYLTRLLVQGSGNVSLGFASTPAAFSAPGLDAGTLTTRATTVVPINFQTPAGQ